MGLYDQALAINAQGQNAALGLRSAALNKPTAVERFMAGLRGGQEQLAKRKQESLQEMLANSLAKQREDRSQQEQEELNYRMSQRPLQEEGSRTDMDYKKALTLNLLSPKAKESAGAPSIVWGDGGGGFIWDAESKGYKPAAGPDGKQLRKYDEPSNPRPEATGRWVPLPTEPGAQAKRMNTLTGEVQDITQGAAPINKPRVAPPEAAVKARVENRSALAELDSAIAEAKSNPSALAEIYTALPDLVSQRMNPKGVSTRAKVSKVAAIKIHDLTGAAQTVQEVARLKPFLPAAGDTPQTIVTKLEGMRAEYERIARERESQIGSSQYLPVGAPAQGQATTSALPKGATGTGVDKETGKTWYRWALDGKRHTSLPPVQ